MSDKLKEPPYSYCSEKHCFKHGLYDGMCADHKIAELEAEKKSIIMNLSSSSRRGLHFRIAAMQAQLDAARRICNDNVLPNNYMCPDADELSRNDLAELILAALNGEGK